MVADQKRQTFVKVAKSTDEVIQTFVDKILAITQLVYQHEQMLIAMEKLERMKLMEFKMTKWCYICHDQFAATDSKRKVANHDQMTGKFLGAAFNTSNLKR